MPAGTGVVVLSAARYANSGCGSFMVKTIVLSSGVVMPGSMLVASPTLNLKALSGSRAWFMYCGPWAPSGLLARLTP